MGILKRFTRPPIHRLRVTVRDYFGSLGPVQYVTGHYTAGPRDRSDKHARELWKLYHEEHKRRGWGGIAYHFGITRRGTIVLLRSPQFKGAHTALHNSGNVGVVMHGTFGDKPSIRQARSFRWLLENAHTSKMPASHRVDLRHKRVRGHKEWPGNATACPGNFLTMYRSGGRRR